MRLLASVLASVEVYCGGREGDVLGGLGFALLETVRSLILRPHDR